MAKHDVAVDDLFALVVDHPEYWSADGVHFAQPGVAAEAEQVVAQHRRSSQAMTKESNMADDQRQRNLEAITSSSSYVLAEQDTRLLAQRELRPVRLQLELLKPEMGLHEHNIESTIVVFGSTRIVERRGSRGPIGCGPAGARGRSARTRSFAIRRRAPSGCWTNAVITTRPANSPGWSRAATNWADRAST